MKMGIIAGLSSDSRLRGNDRPPGGKNKYRSWERYLFLLLDRISVLSNLSARNDEYVRVFLWSPGLLPLACRFAPASLEPSETSALSSFTTAVWMVYRVLSGTADGRPDAEPAASSSFTRVHEPMLVVRNLAYGSECLFVHFANLGRWHLDHRVSPVVTDDLGEYAGCASRLCA